MTQDKTLSCRDCGAQFVFTASEQDFFAQKGFTNEPGRCPDCRAARKQQNGGGFNRGGGNSYQQREMHDATCASCGVKTQVPFRPSGDRPVYCRDCYSQNNSRRY
jgi:CxxC-x17-CxxC domain-containing protein